MRAQAVGIFNAKQSRGGDGLAHFAVAFFRLCLSLPRCLEQFHIERLFIKCLPNRISRKTLHGLDARFAALTLFRQGLNTFQGVKPVSISGMKRERNDLLEARASFNVSRRMPPRSGY